MQNFKIALTFFAAVLTATCSKKETPVSAESTASQPPKTISQILSHAKPVELYVEAYGSFRFSSQSILTVTTSAQTRTFEGSSALEIDERGNYRLVRIPLTGENAVELIYIDQKAYIRLGSDKDFRATRPMPEFQRWVNVSLREIFSLYEKAEFGKESDPVTKNQLRCLTETDGTLCVDPETGLPVEGNLKLELKGNSVTQVRFNVVPAKNKAITIGPPTGK